MPLGAAVRGTASSCSPHVVRAHAHQQRRGWVERAGACAPRTPVWLSRTGWLTALAVWAATPAFVTAKASARVSITAATLLAVATVMAEHADHGTGRHVAVTRARIAARVGCSTDTVTVAWRLLREAGWAIEAQRGHGSPSTPPEGRRPSVYHLISRREPQPVVHNPDLPPKAGSCLLSSVGKYSPSARTTRAEGNPFKKRRPYRAEPRPLELQRLAATLVANSHGLRHGHIGAICDVLTAAGIDPHHWNARQLTDALNTDMRATGQRWPDQIERPAAFLAHRLRRLHLPTDPHPAPTATKTTNDGGYAASLEEKPAEPRQPLTTAQRARIAAARAEIYAVLRRRVTAEPTPEAPKSAQRRRAPVKAHGRCAVGQAEP